MDVAWLTDVERAARERAFTLFDEGFGHFVTTISTSGLKIVPQQSVYGATKNAVRTIHEGLRQEAGPHLRVTGISPGYVRTELATASIQHEETRKQVEEQMAKIAIAPEAIAFAIDRPDDVDVGDIIVRPTAQSWRPPRRFPPRVLPPTVVRTQPYLPRTPN